MKITQMILIVLVTALLINFLREGTSFTALPEVLPFCGGQEPSLLYDLLGGGSLILLGLWGLRRLRRRGSPPLEENPPEEYDQYAPDDQEDQP